MASDDDDNTAAIYVDEDLDEEDDDESEDLQNQQMDEDDVDLIDDVEEEEEDAEEVEEYESISSPAGEVTIAVAGIPNTAAATPTATVTPTSTATASVEVKKPLAVDDSRRLFQRLWTDEDEIELLQGFLDYITQRGTNNSHHHDTAAFYDQIKGKLQLDFNKNQLVEKLRRLKKKYRNVLNKISSGKDYVFKSPHDQATFEISCKIWNETAAAAVPISATPDVVGIDDEENHHVNANMSFNLNEHNGNEFTDPSYMEKKTPRSRKRSKTASVAVKMEETYNQQQQQQQYGHGVVPGVGVADPVTSNVVEETVKSCLLPLFKELVNNNSSNGCGTRGFGFGLGGMNTNMNMNMNMNPFGGSMNFSIGDMKDEKWRKQHILELEVYSKRLALMQDQIKSRLEELRTIGS
ncbi:probable transcription factor At3g04930 [Rutidosis leptorrhynchoides]|uniref:probable transcription factor At3g04930 n=1 Tax=Rutidosis leptorrhynchoides TaxID=125765 RepID=UPI003A993023